ncbi:hypothetical protein GLE_5424 [Lysobacter enzymogenes]|uniref:Uncharacterized protein n=1 Tax=Lysobacter enzymogenes TaxID=69 RepID=A0A0S2DQU5_LYSEN|nr:hypothetical protein GLE_5424 [Lysobacter enzymogenes]
MGGASAPTPFDPMRHTAQDRRPATSASPPPRRADLPALAAIAAHTPP